MRTISECSIGGCAEITGVPGTARGLCSKHYNRWKRHGDPEHVAVVHWESVAEQFEFYATHRPENGCWLWQGYFGNDLGYGVLHSKGQTIQAHRASFETYVRPLEAGEIVRHKCDNPPCVKPQHLEAGTHQDNSDDKWRRGRGNPPLGERHASSKFTPGEVLIIRDILRQGVYTQTFLARCFGVSGTAIWSIANNKTWRHVQTRDAA